MTDKGNDARVTFETASTPQTFSFEKTGGDSDEPVFRIVSDGEDRFLTVTGLQRTRLAFTLSEEDALTFRLEIDDLTGLKVINASAKIYGVAGGVKVTGASGAVAVYTVDGRLVTTQAVISPDQTVAVPAGIYIVKNGANVAKVVVK